MLSWAALVAAAQRDIEAGGGIVLNTLPGPDLGSVRFVLSDDPVRAWEGLPGRLGNDDPDDPVDPRD